MASLSDYELVRLENIRKNEEFLKSLELSAVKSSFHVKSTDTTLEDRPKKKRKSVNQEEEVLPARRSTRSKAPLDNDIKEEFMYLDDENVISITKERRVSDYTKREVDMNNEEYDDERVPINAKILSDYIQFANPEHFEECSNKEISHCAMRIGYMTNKALILRLNAIGKFARRAKYEKLLIFYYGLKACNLNSIAAAAADILADIGVYVGDGTTDDANRLSDSSDDGDDVNNDVEQCEGEDDDVNEYGKPIRQPQKKNSKQNKQSSNNGSSNKLHRMDTDKTVYSDNDNDNDDECDIKYEEDENEVTTDNAPLSRVKGSRQSKRTAATKIISYAEPTDNIDNEDDEDDVEKTAPRLIQGKVQMKYTSRNTATLQQSSTPITRKAFKIEKGLISAENVTETETDINGESDYALDNSNYWDTADTSSINNNESNITTETTGQVVIKSEPIATSTSTATTTTSTTRRSSRSHSLSPSSVTIPATSSTVKRVKSTSALPSPTHIRGSTSTIQSTPTPTTSATKQARQAPLRIKKVVNECGEEEEVIQVFREKTVPVVIEV